MDETLAAGDLTTAFAKWLEGRSLSPDANTDIRDALTTDQGYASARDATSVLARFLRDRT